MQCPVPGCNPVPRVKVLLREHRGQDPDKTVRVSGHLPLHDVGLVVQDGGGQVGEVEVLEDGRDVGAEAGGQAQLLQGPDQQGGQRGGQGGLPAGTGPVTTEISYS